jgi:hypothetical protein
MVRTPAACVLALLALAAWAPAASARQGGAHSPNPQTIDAARATVICLINQRRHHHHVDGFRATRRSAPPLSVTAVILSKRWRQIGVGVSIGSPLGPDGKGMATYTVDFGFRKG